MFYLCDMAKTNKTKELKQSEEMPNSLIISMGDTHRELHHTLYMNAKKAKVPLAQYCRDIFYNSGK